MSVSVLRTFVSLAAALIWTAPTPAADRETVLRSFVESLAGETRLPSEPFRLQVHTTMRPLRSADEVRREYDAVKHLADHPSRRTLEAEMRQLSAPYETERVLWYADKARWSLEHPMRFGMVTFGEFDGVRWAWSDSGERGQITLTREGVPFPQQHDFHKPFQVFLNELRSLTNYGVPASRGRAGSLEVEATTTGSRWTAAIATESGPRVELTGCWEGDAPRVLETRRFGNDGDRSPTWTFSFADSTLDDHGWARRADVVRPDGRLVTTELVATRMVEAREVTRHASVPDIRAIQEAQPGHVVHDYRTAAWLGTPSPTMTAPTPVVFRRGTPAQLAASTPTPDGTRVDPSGAGRSEALSSSPADSKPSSRTSWFIAAAVVVGTAVGIAWWRVHVRTASG